VELVARARQLEEELREKRKSKGLSEPELKLLEERWRGTEREAREADAKAKAIEEAVYDLKAVNPNRASAEDARTPAELLDLIAEKGREADAALERLKGLISGV